MKHFRKNTIIFSVLITMLLSNLATPAADWREIYTKTYIDSSSIYWEKNIVSFWTKNLNPGDWKPFKDKKIWYSKDYMSIDCSRKKIGIKSIIYYDLKHNVIDSWEVNHDSLIDWMHVVPDTNGDVLYKLFCTSY